MTTINWFPGHMHKARKDIAAVMPHMDVIIEVIDARIPFSSENPLIPDLRGSKPLIKLLNKADLADPEVTALWVAHIEQDSGVRALPRHDRASEFDSWDCVDELVDAEDFSQEWGEAAAR